MKKAGFLMALVVVAALLFACTRKNINQLTGNWQKQDGSGTISFSKDGKVQLASGPATLCTLYRLTGKSEIQLDLGILGTSRVRYSLSKDELTLTDSHGSKVKYLRVKEEKAKGSKETQAPVKMQGPVKAQGAEKAAPAKH